MLLSTDNSLQSKQKMSTSLNFKRFPSLSKGGRSFFGPPVFFLLK